MTKPKITIQPTDEHLKKQQRQAKLAAMTDKKVKGKLTIDDLDAKLDIILEQQEEILQIGTTGLKIRNKE